MKDILHVRFMEFKTDILEDEILSTFGSEVLERLLRCHSRKYADIGNKIVSFCRARCVNL